MILDYSEFITNKATRGIVNSQICDNNTELFNHKSVCPFCNIPISNKIYQNSKYEKETWLDGTFLQEEYVVQCRKCGWWEYKYSNESDALSDGIRANDVEYSSAILRSYKDSSIEVPIETLRKYILKKPEIIYNIDPHKMEDLVRSVLADFYPSCIVKALGRTRDGGKDAILIDNDDNQFFVQVKRRSKADATEGVGVLRELIGASIIQENLTGCIFISTADHFSKPAVDYSKQCIDKRIVERFDLIDCKEFMRITNIVADKMPNSWEKLLRFSK